MVYRFIYINLTLLVTTTNIETTFLRIKNCQNNSHTQIKQIMSFLQLTYLFTLKKSLLIYLAYNQ